MSSRPDVSQVQVSAFAAQPGGLLRVSGISCVPAGQRLSDYLNVLEGLLELADAQAELLGDGAVLEHWRSGLVQLEVGQVDAIATVEPNRAGDPTQRRAMRTAPVTVLLPSVRVGGMVHLPAEIERTGPLLTGRTRLAVVSPAVVRSRHLPPDDQPLTFDLCLVNRGRVVAMLPEPDPDVRDPRRACTRRGCEEAAAGACAYRDATGATCGTTWCSNHSHELEGERYCDRHLEVVQVLRSAAGTLQEIRPPAVGDRTLSLVQVLFRELDEPVQALLRPHRSDLPNAVVSSDLHARAQFLDGTLCWERGWGVAVPQGYLIRVLLRVPLGEPPIVKVLVNRTEVFAGVPDWIQSRLSGATVDPEGRRRFVHRLEQLIAGAPGDA